MVIDETQRMHSICQTDREALEDYEFDGIKIKKGQNVTILIHGIHNDENTYSNPEVFDPERKRSSDSFMPFGAGPRNCVAIRFALFEIKLILSKILSTYCFEKCSETIVVIFLSFFFYIYLILYIIFNFRARLITTTQACQNQKIQ